MQTIKTFRELLAGQRVVPVVVLQDQAQTLGLCDALLKGGINVIEITLRNDFGLQAIKLAKQHFPDMLVLAGTVNSAADMQAAVTAGADGIISPGFTDELSAAAKHHQIPYLPGVATASEILQVLASGLSECKLFPADVAGGVAALKAYSGPFSGVSFCPTGGVNQNNAAEYLASPNVMCVGGSWLAPTAMVKAGDWAGITQLCKESLA